MDHSEVTLLKEEVRRLRSRQRMLEILTAVLLIACAGISITSLAGLRSVSASSTATDKDGVLHVKGLVVEDPSGHERLRLGAPLPDPMVHGVRKRRAAPISGLLIADANGNERGAYVTDDKAGEAFLSLDADGEQQVLFLANPGGGVNFDLFDSKGNEAAITVFPKGPKLKMRKAGQTVLELPADEATPPK